MIDVEAFHIVKDIVLLYSVEKEGFFIIVVIVAVPSKANGAKTMVTIFA